jgi:hypothetical protein
VSPLSVAGAATGRHTARRPSDVNSIGLAQETVSG